MQVSWLEFEGAAVSGTGWPLVIMFSPTTHQRCFWNDQREAPQGHCDNVPEETLSD